MSAEGIALDLSLWFLFGAQHSLLAQKGTKDRVARWLGRSFANRWYALLYFTSQCLVYPLFWAAVSHLEPGPALWVLPRSLYLPHFLLKVGGHSLIILSFLASDVASFTGVRQAISGPREPELVVAFPYSVSRHPLYVGIVLSLLASTGVYTARLLIDLACLIAYIGIGVKFEERQLTRIFGEKYERYRSRVPRFLPRFAPRRLAIRVLLPVAWRLSRARTAQALYQFSATETDSAWQNLRALRFVTEPKIRARMFQHALEEARHGILFKELGDRYGDGEKPVPVAERRPLWKPLPEAQALVQFYEHEDVGELAVRGDFEAYAAACPYPDIRDLFRRVQADEEGHASYTAEMRRGLGLRGQTLQRIKVRASRIYGTWRGLAEILSAVVATLLLSAAYFLLGPPIRFALGGRRGRS